MSVNLVFETHSLTEDNERGVATGWLEGKLSESGRRLARELGERRRPDSPAAVFTSDLARALETATIAFGESGVPILNDWRLRECNYGALNGMPSEQLHRERARHLDEPFPEGESWRQAVDRHRSFLEDIARLYDGERVVVIAHLATWWALDHFLTGTSLDALLLDPPTWQEGWHYTLPAGLALPR